jgi:hypothetical protein
MEVTITADTIEEVTTELKVLFQLKINWGLAYIYPKCPKAKAFAHLVNKKTLSPNDLKQIAYLGFRIDFIGIATSTYEEYNKNGFVGFQKFLDNWRI